MRFYNIAFTVDESYIQHLAVAIASLLYNNRDVTFKIYVLHNNKTKGVMDILCKLKHVSNVKFYTIEVKDESLCDLVVTNHFKIASYYRLLIPDLIEEEVILYLDSDIVVNDSIKGLFQHDLSNYYIGAVVNPGFNRHSELCMNVNADYFNAGVMLINSIKWREDELAKKVCDFVRRKPDVIRFVDQCGLNAIINGRWLKLELKYNQQHSFFIQDTSIELNSYSTREFKKAQEKPVIIHYTGSSKPWHFMNHHPYKKTYWRYLRMTPFKYYIPEGLSLLNIAKKIVPENTKKLIKGKIKRC